MMTYDELLPYVLELEAETLRRGYARCSYASMASAATDWAYGSITFTQALDRCRRAHQLRWSE